MLLNLLQRISMEVMKMNSKSLIKRLIRVIRRKEEIVRELNRRVLYWHHMYKIDLRMVEEFSQQNEKLSIKIEKLQEWQAAKYKYKQVLDEIKELCKQALRDNKKSGINADYILNIINKARTSDGQG